MVVEAVSNLKRWFYITRCECSRLGASLLAPPPHGAAPLAALPSGVSWLESSPPGVAYVSRSAATRADTVLRHPLEYDIIELIFRRSSLAQISTARPEARGRRAVPYTYPSRCGSIRTPPACPSLLTRGASIVWPACAVAAAWCCYATLVSPLLLDWCVGLPLTSVVTSGRLVYFAVLTVPPLATPLASHTVVWHVAARPSARCRSVLPAPRCQPPFGASWCESPPSEAMPLAPPALGALPLASRLATSPRGATPLASPSLE